MQSLFFSHMRHLSSLLFLFPTTMLAHQSLLSLYIPYFSFSLYLWVSVSIPMLFGMVHTWMHFLTSHAASTSVPFFSVGFIFPKTCNFPFHLPWILLSFVPEQFTFFTPCTQLSLVFQTLLPSQCLTQLLFLVRINLTFSSMSPMKFITSS